MAICNDFKNILKCLFFLGLYYHGIKMFKTKDSDIAGKNNQFFVHSAYVSSAYSTKQSRDLVKHGTYWILILF